ncbi:cysteine desulfurase [Buchnera aphidicola (Nipponaphis monzeni)]|uniref:Cysteine desulfurase IscS n=1 Tax=Buchnera aphidicola (Nipponaphis monzeni) TaxID=2495405 RepID=A0A455TAU9_9GAMM|nr:IscS subfamily cysteine desulfurase [Buchnera aphidicola]BBI01446.1 cysteine desulfurase [Buchnera aphidicola (Nipponaphis monzeni)]
MKLPIYLDYAATTPVDHRVVKKMLNFLTNEGKFGNAASRSHKFGWVAEEAVDIARCQVAELIHADSREIIFTSGATESNNLAIKGSAILYQSKGNHIITSQTEHKSVLDSCRYLESIGFLITYLKPKPDGLISLNKLMSNITKKTILISIMHVNNETGTIQNINAISKICKTHNILCHIDATQSVGKIEINLKKLKIDLMSCSAHKLYGPKGIGCLYVRRKPKVRLMAQIHGGGHERGMRSGTLPVHQIVGMGEAFHIAKENMNLEYRKLNKLRNYFWNKINKIEEVYLNSILKNTASHILNISFNYIEGESLMMALKDLAISSGSACTSASLEPSYVLKALNIKDELAHSSIRFSIGRFTTIKELDYAIMLIYKSVEKLRKLSPLWEMYKSGINIDDITWNHI